MKKESFLSWLKDNVVLFDGAMGTMLYSKGIYFNRCYDELKLSNPDIVKEIHREYINAGVDCIETNTFGANRFKLQNHGFREKLGAINYEGAKIARETAGKEILVAGSIGPLGVRIEPWGSLSATEAKEAFLEQVEALVKGGIDLLILETFSDLSEIRQAIVAVKEVCEFPIIASMTIGDDGNTLYGSSPEKFTMQLDEWGADVIGLNCSVGPQIMLEVLEKIVNITEKPLSVMPNAGTPQNVEGRNIYLASSEYMAEYARRFIKAGAKIVGGCCGTTPDYIKSMRNMVRSILPQQQREIVAIEEKVADKVVPIPLKKKSKLGEKLANGEFTVSVEVVPPRGCDHSKVVESVSVLKKNHVDAVNLPDGPRALSRMSAQHLSVLIQRDVGLEAILHYTCRDRNLLGMMSDMLGLYALGVRNLLIITGDPPKMGDYPDATAVFDVDSIGLINMVNNLNHGIDLGGNRIGKPTGYLIGVGVNPVAVDLKKEIDRFELKVKAGAEYAITQPVFDEKRLIDFLEKTRHLKIPIIAGIWPLVSLRNAEFMNNEIPGVFIPDKVMDRMREAESGDKALKEGISIAKEIILKIRDHVNGIQISAPFGKLSPVLELLSVLDR